MDSIDQLIRRFVRNAGQGRKAVGRISSRVEEYFAHPSRRDGRGRKAQELHAVAKTLGHLRHATAWQCRPDLDANVRQAAKALVKTACHGQVPFDQLMRQASALRGRVNDDGRKRNARRPIKGCLPLREELPQHFSVERLHTVELLAKAGSKLGNCAKNNAHCLHDRLRKRRSDFYLLRRGDEPVAMLEVKLRTGEITEFLGQRNDDIDLPRAVLMALLRCLRLNGDHVEACLQKGAASIFVTGSKDPHKPDWQRRRLMVWCAKRQLVIQEVRGQRWSSFKWNGRYWMASEGSIRGCLDDLMTRHPHIAVLAHEAADLRNRQKRKRGTAVRRRCNPDD